MPLTRPPGTRPPADTGTLRPSLAVAKAVYLGIDPGASGGLAVVAVDTVEAVPMPATERDVWDWFHWYDPGQRPFAVIEQVGGYVGSSGKGGGAANGSAMFKFGVSYGGLRMALTAAGIPFEAVVPRKWQGALAIPGKRKSESKTNWKNRLKAAASNLFPQTRVTLATADALLIAEYCRRVHTGTLAR